MENLANLALHSKYQLEWICNSLDFVSWSKLLTSCVIDAREQNYIS